MRSHPDRFDRESAGDIAGLRVIYRNETSGLGYCGRLGRGEILVYDKR
jgi:hypothetical protein